MAKYARQRCIPPSLPIAEEGIDAMVLFGSVARGDSDHLSDRDLLLVSDDSSSLTKSSQKLRALGWSCTGYFWEQLESAVSRRSLFIQHLRLEGIVIYDRDNRCRHLLEGSQQRGSYIWEVNQARELFSLVEVIPKVPWGLGWALDITAVALRSFGFATMADEGSLQYTFDAVLNMLIITGKLKKEEASLLSNLRSWKNCYRRAGEVDVSPALAQKVIDLTGRCMDAEMDCRVVLLEEFVDRVRKESDRSYNWYRTSRAVEANCHAYQATFNSTMLEKIREPSGFLNVELKRNFLNFSEYGLVS